MEQLYVLIHETIIEKQNGSHRVAAEIVAGMIRGSKYWTLEMENQDPRRMHRLIDFLCSLIKNNQTIESASNERFRWRLVQELRHFQWRIPLVWCAINNFAKELLDRPFEIVRENIANILSMSLSFDIILPNGRSTRHPNIDQFINTICERLHQAIVAYEKTPFVPVNVSNQVVEIDFETRKALNLMETVIQLHTYLFDWCQQPVKIATIRIFPYLCEIESIVAKHNFSEDILTISRMRVAMTYLHADLLKALIEQVEK
ncbi:unnamed protein product, partial [Rotaria sordida]